MGNPKIAIVGGGIAGVGAAWSLHRAGHEVELFEKGPALGGNAKTFRWPVEQGYAESPLLVIAWPERYYHNYHLLLDELGLGRTGLPISYFVRSPEGDFRQDGESTLDKRFAGQFKRWNRLVSFVSRVCDFFLPKNKHDSIYHFSYFNPMNVIPLYWMARLFGISKEFWHTIFVPVHCATFITTSKMLSDFVIQVQKAHAFPASQRQLGSLSLCPGYGQVMCRRPEQAMPRAASTSTSWPRTSSLMSSWSLMPHP